MKTKISSFLKERTGRMKPEEANNLNLKRLDKIDFSGEIHLTEKPTKTDMILIKPGDLVISGINVEKGAIAVYQGDEDILATIHYSSYEFDEKKIDINYFKWFLRSDVFKKIVQSQTRGGIKTEMKPKTFLPLEIDLPDLSAQEQILKKINSIKNEIKFVEVSFNVDEKLLSSLRSAILQEAVQGKLVSQNPSDEPASDLLKKIKAEKEKLIKEGKIKKQKPLPKIEEDEIPYELPKGWVWCRLGEITQWALGSGFPKKHQGKDNLPFLFCKVSDMNLPGNEKFINITNNTIDEKLAKEMRVKIHSEGTIIFPKIGGAIATNKRRILNKKSAIDNNCLGVIPYSKIDLEWLFVFFNSIDFMQFQSGTSVPAINQSQIGNIVLGLPPLPEQLRIVEKVDSLMKLCDELEKRIKENKKDSEVLMGAVLRESFEK